LALAAPGRSDGPPLPGVRMRAQEAGASSKSDSRSPREIRFTDVVDLDDNTGSPEWRRPGFAFSARVGVRDADGRLLLETRFGTLSVLASQELPAFSNVRFRVERDGASVALRLLGYGTDETVRGPMSRGVSDSTLLRTLGLPSDALSLALLSFSRAFGLRLDAGLLRTLRRLALQSTVDREASALAAVAAEAKGLRLTPQALEEYVDAIDVNAGRDGEDRRASAGSDEGPSSGGDTGKDGEDRNSGKKEEKRPHNRPPSGEDLRVGFAKSFSSGDALSYLNTLPGPDGTRWIVFPVSLGSEEVEICATVRILLLAAHGPNAGMVGRWAVDVAASGRTWSFDAETPGVRFAPVQVSADPPLGAEAPRIRAALERVLRPFALDVHVSAQTDERPFRERRSEAYTGLDSEA
jgi:hypothetical protein